MYILMIRTNKKSRPDAVKVNTLFRATISAIEWLCYLKDYHVNILIINSENINVFPPVKEFNQSPKD